jgi:non-heme chloroperoxidase
MNTYADDLAELLDQLEVKDAVMVGHSTGGGEVVRYIARHGTPRVSKVVLIGAVPPIMVKSESNPGGTPIENFDSVRAGVAGDRSQFWKDFSLPFYGFNKPDAKVSEGLRDSFWLQGMAMSIKGAYDCIKAFSETDFSEDLKQPDTPTLVMHGDADQIVPFADSAELTAKLVKGAKLKVYPGAPHGICQTMPDTLNADMLAFIRS